ncbi:hypothetical protein VKT23_009901 [Stygiomarasmius scandens]|uniref:Uncharacterized protein n=1 Tax=Marasmiellus scandens TaxID=2682957 RepID=A0ABR1JDN8_9AGAR
MRWCDFTFFKAPKLPTLGLLQIELDEEMLELRVPFNVTKILAEGFSSGVVSVTEVFRHGLHTPEYPPNNIASPRPLVTQVVKFNFGNDLSSEQYNTQIHQVMTAFRNMGVNEVVIFVATHADPDRGDVHFAPHGGGAQALEVVFPVLFTRQLQQWLTSVQSHLFTLICGQVASNIETSGVFNNIFCFPTPQFQPRKASTFTSGFVEQVIYRQIPTDTALNYILRDDSKLGLHSKILRLASMSNEKGGVTCRAVRYVWTQDHRRPWGLEYPMKCWKCQSMQSFSSLGDFEAHPRLKMWECRGRLPGNGVNLGKPCLESFQVVLDETECSLVKGTKEGMWQHHDFKWSEEIMGRF